MNSFSRLLNRYQRRTWLIGLVVLLLLLNLGRRLGDNYEEETTALESRLITLDRFKSQTANTEELRNRLARLQEKREKLVTHLFSGVNDEEIVSAMQLNLQALVSAAGLDSESIRPVQQRSGREEEGEKDGAGIGEVAIKARLVGTLSEYLELLTLLTRSEKFFKVESFTLSPYKKAGLKIALELRGYFITVNPADGAGPAGNEAGITEG